MQKPTILQLIPELETGGAERGAVDMANAIVAAGGRALIVSAGGKLAAELPLGSDLHWPSAKSKNPLRIIGNALRLVRLIRRMRVDLVHARSRAPAWSGWLAAKLAGVPFMTTFHSTYNFRSAPKRLYNSVMARGRRVIAISDFIRQHILANYATDPAAIRLIHRGIDAEQFDPARVEAARLDALRAAWGLPDGVAVILLPGRLTRWKGQRVLIEAMAQLQDQQAVAVCVGSAQGRDEYVAELRQLSAQHGLERRVLLPGDCRDMPAALALATIVVSASVEPEAFGRVIVEAQAMGKPVIVSDCGAVRETVGASGGGWIVPPDNAAALAGALDTALAMPEGERRVLGERGRAYVTAHYTAAQMAAKTLAVYNELLPADRQLRV